MHAEQCPICGGSGKGTLPDIPQTAAVQVPSTCHGCNGKGWVQVEDSELCSIPAEFVVRSPLIPFLIGCDHAYWDGGVVDDANPPDMPAQVPTKFDSAYSDSVAETGQEPDE